LQRIPECSERTPARFRWRAQTDEQRKYAILFAATILAARKLNNPESKPRGIECVLSDAIERAERILAKIDERWPINGEVAPTRSNNWPSVRKLVTALIHSTSPWSGRFPVQGLREYAVRISQKA